MKIQAHTFRARDVIAGHVALDLVNTVSARDADAVDWLDGYPALLSWAGLTGEFDKRALRALERACAADPRAAARAVRRTRELREALHEVAQPIITGHSVHPAALDRLDRIWKRAVTQSHLTVADGHAHPHLTVEACGLEYLNHELALRSVDLLQVLPLARTRICPGCGWLFIDRSKGGQRRWCDMATCGNAAKTSRHRERSRQAGR